MTDETPPSKTKTPSKKYTPPKQQSALKDIFDLGRIIIEALLIALIIRTFLFQPFTIPSGSMIPTLQIGDYLFVSKYSYGYSRFSLPFSPNIFSGRLLSGTPERGDVIVFRLPRDNETDYIKRLIGLPRDRIQMREGVLYINDEAVPRERLSEDLSVETENRGRVRMRQYRETLPNGKSYITLDQEYETSADNTVEYIVPEGHYFMMGDNRDNSQDSRYLDAVGMVPFVNLVGKAQFVAFSTEGGQPWEFWRWPWTVRKDRLFSSID